jgi:hypothetical protein
MAIVKANFYKHELNQFLPNRVRGEYLDWGLNAMVMEVQIDASETGTLYAGDPVKIVSTSKGKLKVVAAGADAAFGFILFNPKHETAKAGDIVSVLCKDGVISEVTEEAISAGVSVYYVAADGSVSATGAQGQAPMGITLEATSATTGGALVAVLVK